MREAWKIRKIKGIGKPRLGNIQNTRKIFMYDAQAIRFYRNELGLPYSILIKIFGVSSGCIRQILMNETYKTQDILA